MVAVNCFDTEESVFDGVFVYDECFFGEAYVVVEVNDEPGVCAGNGDAVCLRHVAGEGKRAEFSKFVLDMPFEEGKFWKEDDSCKEERNKEHFAKERETLVERLFGELLVARRVECPDEFSDERGKLHHFFNTAGSKAIYTFRAYL